MDSEFDNLIILQNLDDSIREASRFFQKIPSQIQTIEKNIEESLQIVQKARDALSRNQKDRRELEAEEEDLKTRIARYKQQLNTVKTNREYSFLLKEIEDTQQNRDSFEEEIISKMLEADELQEDILAASKKVEEAQTKFSSERDILLAKKKEIEKRLEQLNQGRENLVPKIPDEMMALYTMISKKNNGIALSAVTDDFCSMCHMRIRPQMLNELKEENSEILCENCGRILYWVKKSA